MKQEFRRQLKAFIAVCIAVFQMTALLTPCLAADDSKVLRVAFPEAYGFTMTAADGTRYGLVVDALHEIAKYTGWKYEYIDVQGNELLDRFEAGEFDLMGGQYYLDGLAEYYGYPDYNCGYSKLTLLARKDDGRIKSYDYNTFQGKTIGVFERNQENIRRLQIYLELNGLDCALKYYSYDQLMEQGNLNQFLESGEVDLLLGNSSDAGEKFYIAASFDSQPHYIVTAPGNQEILDGLNMALEKIYDIDPDFFQKLYESNFLNAKNSNAALNSQEREYIQQKGTVTVAVPRDWHPFFCLRNNSIHDGLVPDILKEVADYSGLRFSYLYCDSYADSLAKVQNGEADMLGFFIGTEEDAVEKNMALTASYVELSSIVVRNKESSYPAEGLVGAVLKGRTMPQNITAEDVRYYSNIQDALSDVNRGKVDFFYGVSTHLESIIQKNNFTNLMQVNLVNDSLDIGFALTSPVQPELFSILNKAIDNMTDEEKNAVSNRNIVSIGDTQMTFLDYILANPVFSISVVFVLLLLVLVTVIFISRSRLRAAEMRGELEKAEADNRAKSEFLSRMSHEIRTPMNAIVGLTDLMGMSSELPDKEKDNLSKIKSSSQYLLSLINDILDMSRIENGKMNMASEPFSLNTVLDEIENMLQGEAAGKHLNFQLKKEIRDDVLVGDAIRLRQVILNLLSNAFKFTPAGGTVVTEVAEGEATEQEAAFTVKVTDSGVGIAEEDQSRIFQSFEQLGSNSSKSQGTGLGLAISKNIVQLMGGDLQLKSELGKGSAFYFTITLPKGRIEDVQSRAPEPDNQFLQGASILLAEDNDLNAEIVLELLSAQGAAVRRVETGKKAFELFRESLPDTFDVILMDIMMPEMNGLEATEAIRNLSRPDAKTIPIIAMTANAFQKDQESALNAGMTGFVSKPIDIASLYQELRKALNSSCNKKDQTEP